VNIKIIDYEILALFNQLSGAKCPPSDGSPREVSFLQMTPAIRNRISLTTPVSPIQRFVIIRSQEMANHTLSVKSSKREELIDITTKVANAIEQSGESEGVCVVFSKHTTCGITVNENADPDVQTDMLGFLRKLIPQYEPDFRHFEHNSDAHIKTSIIGSSSSVPFSGGRLLLGRWQAIYLCEFDGPRERDVVVMMIK